jgi:hypothetical protein
LRGATLVQTSEQPPPPTASPCTPVVAPLARSWTRSQCHALPRSGARLGGAPRDGARSATGCCRALLAPHLAIGTWSHLGGRPAFGICQQRRFGYRSKGPVVLVHNRPKGARGDPSDVITSTPTLGPSCSAGPPTKPRSSPSGPRWAYRARFRRHHPRATVGRRPLFPVRVCTGSTHDLRVDHKTFTYCDPR